jgi:Fe-S-cluster containining protein
MVTGICVGCGMCCDGTMYRTVDVDEADELTPLRAAGAVWATASGITSFLQPCSAFGAGCCSIYDGRPGVCRTYRCRLLRRYEAGEVSYEDARGLIDSTVAVRDRVRSGLTAYVEPEKLEALEGLYRVMNAKLETTADPAAARREHADLLLEVVALRVVLAREFEPRDTPSHQPEEPPRMIES